MFINSESGTPPNPATRTPFSSQQNCPFRRSSQCPKHSGSSTMGGEGRIRMQVVRIRICPWPLRAGYQRSLSRKPKYSDRLIKSSSWQKWSQPLQPTSRAAFPKLIESLFSSISTLPTKGAKLRLYSRPTSSRTPPAAVGSWPKPRI